MVRWNRKRRRQLWTPLDTEMVLPIRPRPTAIAVRIHGLVKFLLIFFFQLLTVPNSLLPSSATTEFGSDPPVRSQHKVGSHRTGRRSSMKQGGGRRSSIGYRDDIVNTLPYGKTAVRRQSISFDDAMTEVRRIEPTKNLAENPGELWFQKDEFNLIREKAIFLTNIAKSNRDGDTSAAARPKGQHNKLCFRGLESHIDSEYIEYEQHEAWKAVFLEQYHQMTQCDFDEEAVAKLYEVASLPARARALKRAEGDMIEAEKHTRSMAGRRGRRHSLI
jgi:hypothetical protein